MSGSTKKVTEQDKIQNRIRYRTGSVSYTHLDVYKRQVEYCIDHGARAAYDCGILYGLERSCLVK